MKIVLDLHIVSARQAHQQQETDPNNSKIKMGKRASLILALFPPSTTCNTIQATVSQVMNSLARGMRLYSLLGMLCTSLTPRPYIDWV